MIPGIRGREGVKPDEKALHRPKPKTAVKRTCSEVGCSKTMRARKLCATHYTAWQRGQKKCVTPGCRLMQAGHGRCRPHERLHLTAGKSDAIQQERLTRFRKSIEPDADTGCWIWAGPTNEHGYGMFIAGGSWYAHRFSYVWFVGGHERGKQLDHLCNNILCVRPDHLFAITGTNNTKLRDQRALNPQPDFFRHSRITPRYLSVIKFGAKTGLPTRKPRRRRDVDATHQ